MEISYPSAVYPKRLDRPLTDVEKTAYWVDMIITGNKHIYRSMVDRVGHLPVSETATITNRFLKQSIQWTVITVSPAYFDEVKGWWHSGEFIKAGERK